MNAFEEIFFKKYIPEGQEIRGIVHIHPIDILWKIFLYMFMGVFVPSYFYILSTRIQELVPFYILEIWLLLVFIKIIYEIFDWYNDVWILTNSGVVSLEWSFLKTNTQTLGFDNIEWIEVAKNGIFDSLFKKWDLVIHKIGSDEFVLKNAHKPYISIDEIESISNEYEQMWNEEPDHRLSVIMDALGGVVENYLEKQDTKQFDRDDFMHEYEKQKDTIDMR